MKAWIIKDIAPLKVRPQWDCELADEVLFGMPIEILHHEKEDWYGIRTHYGYEGFLHSSQFLVEELCDENWVKAKKRVVMKAYADVLSEAKVQGSFLQGVPRGGRIALLDKQEGYWQGVLLPNGVEGWIRQESIAPLIEDYSVEEEEALRNRLVETAELYMGAQYRWGGKTLRGLDCSGLCSMAYMLNGILIYRDANLVEGYPLKEIPKDEIKKGDLLFFPGHVAMYIEDGRYIHSAAGRNGVAYNSLNPDHDDFNQSLLDCFEQAGSIF